MISFKEVEDIHQFLITEFGGANGIRNKEQLSSALDRPLQTFDSKQPSPTPIEKAASLIESILIDHPFVDGNKRTGYVLMRLILLGVYTRSWQNECSIAMAWNKKWNDDRYHYEK